jgi:hypothetical protein
VRIVQESEVCLELRYFLVFVADAERTIVGWAANPHPKETNRSVVLSLLEGLFAVI